MNLLAPARKLSIPPTRDDMFATVTDLENRIFRKMANGRQGMRMA